MNVSNIDIRQIVDFLQLTSRLKSEGRHCVDASGTRQESVAEHCFQLVLMAFLVSPQLEKSVDVNRVIKLCICHDLVETIVGDAPYIEGADRKARRVAEEKGLTKLVANLPVAVAEEIKSLWFEFENCITPEAKCAKALDNLEAQLQHNIAPLSSWEEREFPMVFTKMDRWCGHDATLQKLCETIKADACEKMKAAGIDPRRYDINRQNRNP